MFLFEIIYLKLSKNFYPNHMAYINWIINFNNFKFFFWLEIPTTQMIICHFAPILIHNVLRVNFRLDYSFISWLSSYYSLIF